jgi:GTP-binding protein HflX
MVAFPPPEKAILVGIEFSQRPHVPVAESLQELSRLAYSSRARVVAQFTQKRERPDPKYFIGCGKIEEIHAAVHTHDADLVIFDHELSPGQEHNLAEALGVKVIDRTALILDIFAQHAKTREGALQVELAQHQFLLPRLTGKGVELSRLGGGIGTRGPGETKLEYDRRRIKKKISQLKQELEKLRAQRQLQREKRRAAALPLISIVGYTNAGKSTLLNALTGAKVLTQDQLFATLDPTVRRLKLSGGKIALISDTVGFIQKLPHQLVEAFHATLEEVTEADLLLHVVDAAHPHFEDQISAVYNVLEEIGAIAKKMITVFNKADLLNTPEQKEKIKKAAQKYTPAVLLSAQNQVGLADLLSQINFAIKTAG